MKTAIERICSSSGRFERHLWLVTLICLTQAGLRADPLDAWTLQSPAATTNDLRAVAYGNGQFVAVGGGYYNYRPQGSSVILTSPDGIVWTARDPGTTNGLYGVTYGNGLFAAVGMNDTIITSPEGVIWTVRNVGTNELHGIAYGNGRFVAVGVNRPVGQVIGESANGITFASLDGINWVGSDSISDGLFAVVYANGLFVAGGGVFTPASVHSTNGISWHGPNNAVALYLTGVAHGYNDFLAVGFGNWESCITSSPDGVTWTLQKSGITNSLNSIAFGNHVFVVTGGGSNLLRPLNPSTIVTSQDGVTWTPRNPVTTNGLYGVAYGNGHFVAVGANGTILRSGEIVSLDPVSVSGGPAQTSITGVAGHNYQIETSTNLTDWVSLTNVVTNPNGTAQFGDSSTTNFNRRFYRAVTR